MSRLCALFFVITSTKRIWRVRNSERVVAVYSNPENTAGGWGGSHRPHGDGRDADG